MINIYTDGACSGNPGFGAFAVVVVNDDEVEESFAGWDRYTTNNRMELMGVLEAIRYIRRNRLSYCCIHSDSMYVVNGINKWLSNWHWNRWVGSNKKEIKNCDLWKIIYKEWIESGTVVDCDIRHVKGHNNNPFNELADTLATKCIDDNKKK